MLFARPEPVEGIEIINDANGWLTNFWRAAKLHPRRLARALDYPVSELDLHARGDWLFYRRGAAAWIEWLRGGPKRCDVEAAAWWCWGQCSWIGCGWGHINGNAGIHRKRPQVAHGLGVQRQIPMLTCGRGVQAFFSRAEMLVQYIAQIAARLERVRICCGDWRRVVTPVCLHSHATDRGAAAIFLDPPYGAADRDANLYGDHDSLDVAGEVRTWCRTAGRDRRLRIALCGYAGEGHESLEAHGWRVLAMEGPGGLFPRQEPEPQT